MSFESLFAWLLLAAGLIWLIDTLIFRPRRKLPGGGELPEPVLVQQARSFFPVILIVLVIRAFLIEPFRIPSESMMPGLIDGDFIVVSKFSYGLRLPLLNFKFLDTGSPQRGDVIVFRLPSNPSENYIKRLIGLPGDHIRVRNNELFVNGAKIIATPAGAYAGTDPFKGAELKREQLGAGDHTIMLFAGLPATDYETAVPPGHYFFMGDNRNDSQDSRFPVVGFVPEANLVGHALRIWLNWAWPHSPQWQRVGRKIN